MFHKIKCWLCGEDMIYVYDKEMEESFGYRFDCPLCNESVICPKNSPYLKKNNDKYEQKEVK